MQQISLDTTNEILTFQVAANLIRKISNRWSRSILSLYHEYDGFEQHGGDNSEQHDNGFEQHDNDSE